KPKKETDIGPLNTTKSLNTATTIEEDCWKNAPPTTWSISGTGKALISLLLFNLIETRLQCFHQIHHFLRLLFGRFNNLLLMNLLLNAFFERLSVRIAIILRLKCSC